MLPGQVLVEEVTMKKPKDPLYGGGARFGASPPSGVKYEHSQKAPARKKKAPARKRTP
jgi:hypothetical protein